MKLEDPLGSIKDSGDEMTPVSKMQERAELFSKKRKSPVGTAKKINENAELQFIVENFKKLEK